MCSLRKGIVVQNSDFNFLLKLPKAVFLEFVSRNSDPQSGKNILFLAICVRRWSLRHSKAHFFLKNSTMYPNYYTCFIQISKLSPVISLMSWIKLQRFVKFLIEISVLHIPPFLFSNQIFIQLRSSNEIEMFWKKLLTLYGQNYTSWQLGRNVVFKMQIVVGMIYSPMWKIYKIWQWLAWQSVC